MDNKQQDILPITELPAPQQNIESPEAGKQDHYDESQSSKAMEQNPAWAGLPVKGQAAMDAADPGAGVPHTPPPDGTNGIVAIPAIADDADLIEKEWVDRAKRIVEHTKHDPYTQNKHMNVMKADYLKKRYNKDIKLSE